MSNRSYLQIQQEITKLQEEAERVRMTEVAGVVERIKEAIQSYGLVPADLFGKSATVLTAKRGSKSKAANTPKYSNGAGGEWVGRGPRPLWLRDALAAGHSLEEFAVGSAAPAKPAPAKKAAAGRTSYKDPATGKSWSGFGRQPDWLKKALAAGQTLESMQA